MRTIEQIWSGHADYTKAASGVARQLALAGMAIVWAFKSGPVPHLQKDRLIFVAALLCLAALAADFLQYVLGSLLYESIGNKWEREGRRHGDIKVRAFYPMTACFWTKIIAVFCAYGLIAVHIAGL